MGTEAFLPGKPSQETSHLSIYHFLKLDRTKNVYGGKGTKIYFPPQQNVSLTVIQTYAEGNFVALETECSDRKI